MTVYITPKGRNFGLHQVDALVEAVQRLRSTYSQADLDTGTGPHYTALRKTFAAAEKFGPSHKEAMSSKT